jgi:transcriptional regulator with XRE-family HTH domain
MAENFSARLVLALEKSSKSQTEIAAESGMTSAYLSDLKHGKRSNPSHEKIAALADSLGVSLSWLLAGEGQMARSPPAGNEVRSSDPKELPAAAGEKSAGGEPVGGAGEIVGTLRGELAEKNRQIERLLGIIERQAAALGGLAERGNTDQTD